MAAAAGSNEEPDLPNRFFPAKLGFVFIFSNPMPSAARSFASTQVELAPTRLSGTNLLAGPTDDADQVAPNWPDIRPSKCTRKSGPLLRFGNHSGSASQPASELSG